MVAKTNELRTLDQRRGQFAWEKVQQPSVRTKEFVNLAKGASALVMANGLMQALAFWQQQSKASQQLVEIVCRWLKKVVFPNTGDDFAAVMEALFKGGAQQYMLATQEALELLRWVKHFAAALGEAEPRGEVQR